MKITAKRIDRDIATGFKRGGGLDPVEVDSPVEYWEVRFETEKKDILEDLPSYDTALDKADKAIDNADGQSAWNADVDYHLEAGGAWGVLVLEVRLEKA